MTLLLVCAVIIGRITVYLVTRFSVIVNSFYEPSPALPLFYSLYLMLIYIWSILLVYYLYKNKHSKTVFSSISMLGIFCSFVLILIFHFVYIAEFEPFELIYIAYDISILTIIMGTLSLVIQKNDATQI